MPKKAISPKRTRSVKKEKTETKPRVRSPKRKYLKGERGGLYYLSSSSKKVYVKKEDHHKIPSLEKLLKTSKRPSVKRILAAEIKNKNEGRGSPTRGWKGLAPNTLKEKRAIAEECGAKKCFLQPKSLKFPICPRKIGKKRSCKPLKVGIQSAINRANQYGYKKEAAKGRKLLKSAK